MRFRISEFEQHFSEANLEKGYRLQQRAKPVLRERHGTHLGYQVAGHLVSLQQNHQEIDHIHCDCMGKYCPHVAALMFSFMERSLGGQAPGKARRQKAHTPSGEIFAKTFAELRSHWKGLLEEGAGPQASYRFLSLLQAVARQPVFAKDMALIAAMSLTGRQAVTSDAMRELTNTVIIRNFAVAKVKSEEEVMYLCLLETLRTSERAASCQFSGILPIYLVLSENMFHLEELRTTLEKRHQKKYQADLFDELMIARSMVFFRCSQLDGGSVKLLRSSPPENFVALARLHFAVQEFEEAWKVLAELKTIMRESPLSYFDFLAYLINLSEAMHDKDRQLEYTEELILYSPYLSNSLARRYVNALPLNDRLERVEKLVQSMISTKSEGTPDKVFVLALASGLPDLFLELCQKHKVKFHMIHELLLAYRRPLGGAELGLYFRRLGEALLQTDFHQARVQLLQMANLILQKLETPLAMSYYGALRDLIGTYPALHALQTMWFELSPLRGKKVRENFNLQA